MYKGKRILAIIPARGGSKGLIRKNTRLLLRRPLIEWTIEAAKKSKYLDRVIVSTDNAAIAGISERLGVEVPFLRPARLANDRALISDVVLHLMARLEKDAGIKWEYIILLQPTSPCRTGSDIDAAIKEFFSHSKADALVTITEVSENPFAMYAVNGEGFLKGLLPDSKEIHRRQDFPKAYKMNGAIYICKTSALRKEKTFCPKKTKAFIMPQERSVDIDDARDLATAERSMKQLLLRKERKAA